VKKKYLFGLPLAQIIICETLPNSGKIYIVPTVILEMFDAIEKQALDTEGIFRVSGNHVLVQELKHKINKGEKVNFLALTPHNICALLKTFFLELPEPLLTYNLYNQFISAVQKQSKEEKCIQFKILFAELPIENLVLLEILISHLCKVVQHSNINKMISSNIGTVFGPNILRKKEVAQLDIEGVKLSQQLSQQVITFLIDEYYLLFNTVRESLAFTTKLCTTKIETTTDHNSSPNLTTPFRRVPEHGISLPEVKTQERERKLNSNSKDSFSSSEEQKSYKTNNGDASKIEYKGLNDKQLQKKMIIVAGGILLGLFLTYLNYTLESEY